MKSASTVINTINAYILANLCEKLTVKELADHVGMSKFHLHRLFYSRTGFEIGEYVKRRKMERAVQMLKVNTPVLDIALALGFESHSSFSRAFKQVYGTAPSNANPEYLNKTVVKHRKKLKDFNKPLDYEVVLRKEEIIYGVHRTIKSMHDLQGVANVCFSKLTEISQHGDYLLAKPVGVSLANPWIKTQAGPDFFWGFSSGLESSKEVDIHPLIWPAGRYVKIVYSGSYLDMWQFICRFHSEYAAQEHFELASRTIYQCYESDNKITDSEAMKTQLFFPLS